MSHAPTTESDDGLRVPFLDRLHAIQELLETNGFRWHRGYGVCREEYDFLYSALRWALVKGVDTPTRAFLFAICGLRLDCDISMESDFRSILAFALAFRHM